MSTVCAHTQVMNINERLHGYIIYNEQHIQTRTELLFTKKPVDRKV